MNSAAVAEITGAVADFAERYLVSTEVCVALSGGADSLALTAAAIRSGLGVRALIVDHGLQPGSAEVAERTALAATGLGAHPRVLRVEVGRSGGPEAAARAARYQALDGARDGLPVLIGHTLDDQAETVLLGLARGSGARSIAGMRPWTAPLGRPLLTIRRAATRAACADLGLSPHDDPHNADPRFTRVRLRAEVLPLLEDVLQGGVAQALARTAEQLRDDLDVVEHVTDQHSASIAGASVACADLATLAPAIRSRLLRRWLLQQGATEPTETVVRAVGALVTGWRGQGPVAVGGAHDHRLEIARRDARLVVERRVR
ncbi:tRNA lysidine(34) synthetase TilS [Williamsia soli]|uniref:tRNA lysidine(34) synthetase TilS n=1 Tax=Williamsia soli TaxID=364929 RepID=UPI001A9E74DE|nr:tRNA lysidine(34) synthetase TilS [Williamsia soli]